MQGKPSKIVLYCVMTVITSATIALTLTLKIETPSPSSQPQKENYDPPPSYPRVQWDDWTL